MAQKKPTEKEIEKLEEELADNMAMISDLKVRNNEIRKLLAGVA